ncbi:BQ2448_8032 [Microbotryum intermedium]|uniref:BQ2448_8032 protein n=1 Tax=Microbotryum intermedium TaxID=269621 RepID=A0A238FSS8_9BASI|nr:BQ2448_8032 [Microbotryum intermedium]
MASVLHLPSSPSATGCRNKWTGSPRHRSGTTSTLPRPGLRRNTSTSSIILSPVLRFSPNSSFIPSPSESTLNLGEASYLDHSNVSPNAPVGSGSSQESRCSFAPETKPQRPTIVTDSPKLTEFVALNEAPRPERLQKSPTVSPTSATTPTAGGSLLARRRSSAANGMRPDIFALSGLKITAPLEQVLDDTVPVKVIGTASAAVTPSKEDLGLPETPTLVVKDFRPTKSFVPTPFPEKRQFISDDEGESDCEGEESEEREERNAD